MAEADENKWRLEVEKFLGALAIDSLPPWHVQGEVEARQTGVQHDNSSQRKVQGE